METLKNVLQPHSSATLFVSIVFNASCITGVVAALTLTIGEKGPLQILCVPKFGKHKLVYRWQHDPVFIFMITIQ